MNYLQYLSRLSTGRFGGGDAARPVVISESTPEPGEFIEQGTIQYQTTAASFEKPRRQESSLKRSNEHEPEQDSAIDKRAKRALVEGPLSYSISSNTPPEGSDSVTWVPPYTDQWPDARQPPGRLQRQTVEPGYLEEGEQASFHESHNPESESLSSGAEPIRAEQAPGFSGQDVHEYSAAQQVVQDSITAETSLRPGLEIGQININVVPPVDQDSATRAAAVPVRRGAPISVAAALRRAGVRRL